MYSAAKSARLRLFPAIERHIDLVAGSALVILTVVAGWDLVIGGTVIGKDTVAQFYPWYSFLGESLRSGEIPAWNPSQFAGAPFAGDPLSGWTYLPAMLLFTVLPVGAAASGYVLFHLLLAGLSTYALARALQINVAGSMLAAVGYEYTGYLYTRYVCCSAYVGVSAWLPLAILGAELAIRSPRWLDRAAWWGLSGLAISQILAAWLGQGSYYALLALGGYVAYRTLLFPPENIRGAWGRASGLFIHGGAVLMFGFGLAAAGILPRLEYQSVSNLAEGYAGIGQAEAIYGGWELANWGKLLVPGINYAGLPTLALALAAPFIARGRHAVPYFVVLSVCALTLSGHEITLLHSTFYDLLPGFEWIHPHGPERVKVVLYLGFALLAGAAFGSLGIQGRSAGALAIVPMLTALFLVTRIVPPPLTGRTPEVLADALGRFREPFPANLGIGIPSATIIALVLILVCVTIYALVPRVRPFAATLVVLIVFVDLFTAGGSVIDSRAAADGTQKTLKVDLSEHYADTGASRFLRSKMEDEPVRYFGYGPHLQGSQRRMHYAKWFADPDSNALLASNLATPLGLQSIQGYNAIQVGRYPEYFEALNGQAQNYHDADVYPAGLDSPLLDLLNVRYIVVPATTQPDQGALRELKDTHPTVFDGERVDVLENRDALPRAWIVHSAKRATPEEALEMLSSGAVDPRKTALLEGPLPKLTDPGDTSEDRASVRRYEANEIELATSTATPGLLVVSEVYYPAWQAYIDGEPVPTYRADQLLRAVRVPAGEHTVELRYESSSLRTGIAISSVTCVALVALLLARMRERRNGQTAENPDQSNSA
jgi:hypothetical protein